MQTEKLILALLQGDKNQRNPTQPQQPLCLNYMQKWSPKAHPLSRLCSDCQHFESLEYKGPCSQASKSILDCEAWSFPEDDSRWAMLNLFGTDTLNT